jgi:hypothetical protein
LYEYNYLVESFKTKHQVADYAEMLNKSPKTSNLFKKYNENHLYKSFKIARSSKRRLLRYSDKSIKEIAYEIGYEDIQSFSRFWKQPAFLHLISRKKSYISQELIRLSALSFILVSIKGCRFTGLERIVSFNDDILLYLDFVRSSRSRSNDGSRLRSN